MTNPLCKDVYEVEFGLSKTVMDRETYTDGPKTMLVVGNSLLLEGVDRATLKKVVAPNCPVTFLPIENIQFEDWNFGLRQLLAEGSRPSIVVICLSTRQMMSR